jgi:hypothetical protein
MTSLLHLLPEVVWDARTADRACGRGGRMGCELVEETPTAAEPYCVFDPARAQFREIAQGGGPEALGAVGDFGDGLLESYWNGNDQSHKGLSLSALGGGYVETFAVAADHVVQSAKVVTGLRVHADALSQGLIEGPEDRSTSYARVWQVLIRRADGGDLTGDAVFPYVSTVALDLGARVDNGQRFVRRVPNRADGWFWMWTVVPAAASTPAYWGVAVPAGGVYEIEAPCNWNIYAGFGNIPRCPILNGVAGSNQRSQHWVQLRSDDGAGDTFACPPSGFLGLGLTLPFGKQDYRDFDGTLTLPSATLAQWTSGPNRLALAVTSYGLTGFVQDGAANYVVYLHHVGDWAAFEPIGVVLRWQERDGNWTAELYVNGRQCDDQYLSLAHPLPFSTLGKLTLGAMADGSNAADAWIERAVAARHTISQDEARELSLLLKDLAQVRASGLLP